MKKTFKKIARLVTNEKPLIVIYETGKVLVRLITRR